MPHFQANAFSVCILCQQLSVEPDALKDSGWGQGYILHEIWGTEKVLTWISVPFILLGGEMK